MKFLFLFPRKNLSGTVEVNYRSMWVECRQHYENSVALVVDEIRKVRVRYSGHCVFSVHVSAAAESLHLDLVFVDHNEVAENNLFIGFVVHSSHSCEVLVNSLRHLQYYTHAFFEVKEIVGRSWLCR